MSKTLERLALITETPSAETPSSETPPPETPSTEA